MATAKPQGWVNASLEMGYLGLAVRKWSQLDNQVNQFEVSAAIGKNSNKSKTTKVLK